MNQLTIHEYGKDAQPKLGMQIIVLFAEMDTITSDIICYGKDGYKLAIGDKWIYYHELSHLINPEIFPFNTPDLRWAAALNNVVETTISWDNKVRTEYRGKFYQEGV